MSCGRALHPVSCPILWTVIEPAALFYGVSSVCLHSPGWDTLEGRDYYPFLLCHGFSVWHMPETESAELRRSGTHLNGCTRAYLQPLKINILPMCSLGRITYNYISYLVGFL